MLQEELVLVIASKMDLEEIVYMHDKAPVHYAQSVWHSLDKTFPDRWIDWAPRSPDLTPTDCLSAVIKECVYATKPRDLQALEVL